MTALVRAGATPFFVDVTADTYTMDPDRLIEGIRALPAGAKATAILPVHLYGAPADMDAIMAIAREAGLRVVEDCAQAHGAALHGRPVGSFGDAAAFSFYPTKNLGAIGDGGAVLSTDPLVAHSVRELREYGWRERFVSHDVGSNSRLDELQAAFLRVGLRYLAADIGRRIGIADAYDQGLSATPMILPPRPVEATHVFHQYVVRTAARDELRTRLANVDIGTGVHYPVPVHLQPAYREASGTSGTLEVTERLAGEIMSLPMFPQLDDGQVRRVTSAVAAASGDG